MIMFMIMIMIIFMIMFMTDILKVQNLTQPDFRWKKNYAKKSVNIFNI